MTTAIGLFLTGFGAGVGITTYYWNRLVKRAHDQIERVLAQNQELLDTWEPKRPVVRDKEFWAKYADDRCRALEDSNAKLTQLTVELGLELAQAKAGRDNALEP